MTAPVWLRLDRESLETNLLDRDHFFFIASGSSWTGVKKKIWRRSLGRHHKAAVLIYSLYLVERFKQPKLEGVKAMDNITSIYILNLH